MAEIRLNKLIKQYHVELKTLVAFLDSIGANVLEDPYSKVSEDFLPELDKQFGRNLEMEQEAKHCLSPKYDFTSEVPYAMPKPDFVSYLDTPVRFLAQYFAEHPDDAVIISGYVRVVNEMSVKELEKLYEDALNNITKAVNEHFKDDKGEKEAARDLIDYISSEVQGSVGEDPVSEELEEVSSISNSDYSNATKDMAAKQKMRSWNITEYPINPLKGERRATVEWAVRNADGTYSVPDLDIINEGLGEKLTAEQCIEIFKKVEVLREYGAFEYVDKGRLADRLNKKKEKLEENRIKFIKVEHGPLKGEILLAISNRKKDELPYRTVTYDGVEYQIIGTVGRSKAGETIYNSLVKDFEEEEKKEKHTVTDASLGGLSKDLGVMLTSKSAKITYMYSGRFSKERSENGARGNKVKNHNDFVDFNTIDGAENMMDYEFSVLLSSTANSKLEGEERRVVEINNNVRHAAGSLYIYVTGGDGKMYPKSVIVKAFNRDFVEKNKDSDVVRNISDAVETIMDSSLSQTERASAGKSVLKSILYFPKDLSLSFNTNENQVTIVQTLADKQIRTSTYTTAEDLMNALLNLSLRFRISRSKMSTPFYKEYIVNNNLLKTDLSSIYNTDASFDFDVEKTKADKSPKSASDAATSVNSTGTNGISGEEAKIDESEEQIQDSTSEVIVNPDDDAGITALKNRHKNKLGKNAAVESKEQIQDSTPEDTVNPDEDEGDVYFRNLHKNGRRKNAVDESKEQIQDSTLEDNSDDDAGDRASKNRHKNKLGEEVVKDSENTKGICNTMSKSKEESSK